MEYASVKEMSTGDREGLVIDLSTSQRTKTAKMVVWP